MKKKSRYSPLYYAVHYWLKHNYGVADKCENKLCPRESSVYHWAKIKDKEYDFKRRHFKRLCASCHSRYDVTEELREKVRKSQAYRRNKQYCLRGHEMTEANTLIITVKGKTGGISHTRNCIQCKNQRTKEWKSRNKEHVREYNRKRYIKEDIINKLKGDTK